MRRNLFRASWFMIILIAAQPIRAQLSPAASWAAHAANDYELIPNVTYLVAGNQEVKLDIYKRRDAPGPQPTLVLLPRRWLERELEGSGTDGAGALARVGLERG